MDFKTMTIEELEARKAQIATESEAEGADVDALLEEVRGINAELEARKVAAQKQAELRAAVAAGAGSVVNKTPKEGRGKKMTPEEMRASHEYNVAYAEYIKTGDPTECRSLMTDNATNGTVAVPTYVEGRVRTAWERDKIARLVKKTYVKGNLGIGFEISSTDATVHTEGSGAVDEETLVLGTVSLVPKSIKKWISLTDEVLDLRGEEFLDYVYDELTYKIAKKAVDVLLEKISALSTTATTTAVNIGVITATQVEIGIMSDALGELSDETDPETTLAVMNKKTWSAFKRAQYANKFNVDPFEGYEVAFNNKLPAFSAATTGDVWMIVGDFANGAQFNFPNGDAIDFKFDEITGMTSDLVKILGRKFVGIDAVAPLAFCKVVK